MKKKIVVFTGAGISAESGIETFRDKDGLWEGYNIMDVAHPDGFKTNPKMVLDFYNRRRKQLRTVEPNAAHKALSRLEEKFDVTVVTQNVDDLHERGGSTNIIHMHGELTKKRSVNDQEKTYPYEDDIKVGDLADDGGQFRPHVVWFSEDVPNMEVAVGHVEEADILIIIGTSLQVYPVAGLCSMTSWETPIYYIDPNPFTAPDLTQKKSFETIEKPATIGVTELVNRLLEE